jgi:hypothetical protein
MNCEYVFSRPEHQMLAAKLIERMKEDGEFLTEDDRFWGLMYSLALNANLA